MKTTWEFLRMRAKRATVVIDISFDFNSKGINEWTPLMNNACINYD